MSLKLKVLNEPCNVCGKNKWMEDVTHVSGREEKTYHCLYCATYKIIYDKHGRRHVKGIHTYYNDLI